MKMGSTSKLQTILALMGKSSAHALGKRPISCCGAQESSSCGERHSATCTASASQREEIAWSPRGQKPLGVLIILPFSQWVRRFLQVNAFFQVNARNLVHWIGWPMEAHYRLIRGRSASQGSQTTKGSSSTARKPVNSSHWIFPRSPMRLK